MKLLLLAGLAGTAALSSTAPAQTALTAWHESGQTWIKWTDNQTFAGADSWSIYRSSAPITDLAQAQLIAKSYPEDAEGAALRVASPTATWVVPDPATSGTLALAASEALFVYTPRAAVAEYFAVVKTGDTLLTSDNTFGPLAQTIAPVRPHAQLTGSNAGHPYTVYALWIDGDSDLGAGRVDFPILGGASFRGVARLFCVFEPTLGLPPAPMPMVAYLHGGDGTFWTNRPSTSAAHQIDLHVEDGLYVTFDDRVWVRAAAPQPDAPTDVRTRWFGFVHAFDRFESPSATPPANAIVSDTAQRALDWILDWFVTTQGVDSERIAFAGLSMGGRGTGLYSRARPERVSAALMFVPPVDQRALPGWDGLFGGPDQNLLTTLGVGYVDLLHLDTPLSALDVPFGRVISGTDDTVVGWIGVPSAYRSIDAQSFGWHLYWDGRGHTNSGGQWLGEQFNGSPKLAVQSLTSFRKSRSFPAFTRVDHAVNNPGQQPDPGDDVFPANGTAAGTWGGYFEWDDATLVDTPTLWSSEMWVVSVSTFPGDVPPTTFARATVGVRRAQAFLPAACTSVDWTLVRVSDGVVLASGSTTVDSSGHVSVPGLLLNTTVVRLELRPGTAIVDCNANGTADACDIELGTSTDANTDGVPDECQSAIALCFGDGSGSACPCANSGASGHGCANSIDPAGGLLAASGVASVVADSMVLLGTNMPNAAVLYFQGTLLLNGGVGLPFGDGLRCAGGAVVRLATQTNVAGASQYPELGEPPLSVRGAIPGIGGLRYYQAWYRNAAMFCTPAAFNLTNAVSVTWTP
jgi:hypothetical protein